MPGHVLVDDSDSDEPIVIAAPPRPPPTRRSRSTSSQPLAERLAESPRRPKKRGRPPRKQKTPPVVDDDDDIVFVRENKARELASLFSFQPLQPPSSGTSSRSRALRQASSAAISSAASLVASSSTLPTTSGSSSVAIPFQPLSTPREPLPVPEWLPKTAILKEIQRCVLCQRDFKKVESGAARWRHLSACLPPAYRPPNAPPDLEVLISVALEGPIEDSTLLRRRTNAAAAADHLMTALPDIVPKSRSTLRNTTVRASHSRDGWSEEVDQRVLEVVGASSPVPARSITPDSTQRSRSASPYSRSPTPPHPATQPLGESTLSAEFTRPERSPTPPLDNLLPQAPPLIGLSQSVRATFAQEEASQSQRAQLALSQAHEHGLEAGDGFHFPSQRSPPRSLPTPSPPNRLFHGGGFSSCSSSDPFPLGGGARTASPRPRNTAGIDPEMRRRLREAVGAGVEEARQRRREAIAAGMGQR